MIFEVSIGLVFGLMAYVVVRCLATGFFTVDQNERVVLTHFGRAERIEGTTSLDDPIAEHLPESDRERYIYPQVRVYGPGGPYFKWPWQKVHKVSVAINTVNIAFDPETPSANHGGTSLEAVTKDQLNIGITGQLRFYVCERNLYAFLFGVKHPVVHVLAYFVSILRERIANFEAPKGAAIVDMSALGVDEAASGSGKHEGITFEGISINDLRKNLNELNVQMDEQCLSSAARYGIVLDASLITGIDPPREIDSALAAINTAHNEVSAEVSIAQAYADQRIVESKKAVEIQTMRAQAETEPLTWLAEQLRQLKQSGSDAIPAYLRNVKLDLYQRAKHIILDMRS